MTALEWLNITSSSNDTTTNQHLPHKQHQEHHHQQQSQSEQLLLELKQSSSQHIASRSRSNSSSSSSSTRSLPPHHHRHHRRDSDSSRGHILHLVSSATTPPQSPVSACLAAAAGIDEDLVVGVTDAVTLSPMIDSSKADAESQNHAPQRHHDEVIDNIAEVLRDMVERVEAADDTSIVTALKYNQQPLSLSLGTSHLDTPPHSAPLSLVDNAPFATRLNKITSSVASLRARVGQNHERLAASLQRLRSAQSHVFQAHVEQQLNKILMLKEQQQQYTPPVIDENSVDLLTSIVKSKLQQGGEERTRGASSTVSTLLRDVHYDLKRKRDDRFYSSSLGGSDMTDESDTDSDDGFAFTNSEGDVYTSTDPFNADYFWHTSRVQLGSEWQRVQTKMKHLAAKNEQCNRYLDATEVVRALPVATSDQSAEEEAAAIAALSSSLRKSVSDISKETKKRPSEDASLLHPTIHDDTPNGTCDTFLSRCNNSAPTKVPSLLSCGSADLFKFDDDSLRSLYFTLSHFNATLFKSLCCCEVTGNTLTKPSCIFCHLLRQYERGELCDELTDTAVTTTSPQQQLISASTFLHADPHVVHLDHSYCRVAAKEQKRVAAKSTRDVKAATKRKQRSNDDDVDYELSLPVAKRHHAPPPIRVMNTATLHSMVNERLGRLFNAKTSPSDFVKVKPRLSIDQPTVIDAGRELSQLDVHKLPNLSYEELKFLGDDEAIMNETPQFDWDARSCRKRKAPKRPDFFYQVNKFGSPLDTQPKSRSIKKARLSNTDDENVAPSGDEQQRRLHAKPIIKVLSEQRNNQVDGKSGTIPSVERLRGGRQRSSSYSSSMCSGDASLVKKTPSRKSSTVSLCPSRFDINDITIPANIVAAHCRTICALPIVEVPTPRFRLLAPTNDPDCDDSGVAEEIETLSDNKALLQRHELAELKERHHVLFKKLEKACMTKKLKDETITRSASTEMKEKCLEEFRRHVTNLETNKKTNSGALQVAPSKREAARRRSSVSLCQLPSQRRIAPTKNENDCLPLASKLVFAKQSLSNENYIGIMMSEACRSGLEVTTIKPSIGSP